MRDTETLRKTRGEGGAVVVNPAYIPHYPGRGTDGNSVEHRPS